jgi:hypothetical protein
MEVLHLKSDSFVVESEVHFLTDNFVFFVSLWEKLLQVEKFIDA